MILLLFFLFIFLRTVVLFFNIWYNFGKKLALFFQRIF